MQLNLGTRHLRPTPRVFRKVVRWQGEVSNKTILSYTEKDQRDTLQFSQKSRRLALRIARL